jgi:hypothetical protein
MFRVTGHPILPTFLLAIGVGYSHLSLKELSNYISLQQESFLELAISVLCSHLQTQRTSQLPKSRGSAANSSLRIFFPLKFASEF